MHIVTVEQVRAADARAAADFAVPGQLLMELAGLHGAKHAWRRLPERGRRRIVVFAGKGNNGGDGFVAARHLHRWGARVKVYAAGPAGGDDADAARARTMAERCGVDVVPWSGEEIRRAALNATAADVIVDAVLGIGAAGPPRGAALQMIDVMNGADKPVVALDLPSGVDADTGSADGAAVRAVETVTFGALKLGLLIGPGRLLAGQVTVADIGWPDPLPEGVGHTWVTPDIVRRRLPERWPAGHKGTFGRVLVVAGSRGMAGAATLAVRGAQRIGAGVVILAAPAGLNGVYATSVPEAMTMALPEDEAGALAKAAVGPVLDGLQRADAVVLGPGLGTGPGARAVVESVLEQARVPVVLDADALNIVASRPEPLSSERGRSLPLVLTPHPGEMARLLGTTAEQVAARPVEAAGEASRRWGAVVALKGAPTVTAEPEGHVYVNGSGSALLASGGSGDVLAGVVAGLLAQGATCVDAAVAGVYVHGRAGNLAASGPAGVLATETADALPRAVAELAADGSPCWTNHVKARVVRIYE